MNTKKLTTLALLTATALILSLIDSLLPPPVPVPGIKLGLANIIVLFVLMQYSKKEALCVLFAKIFLTSFFAGQFFTLFYSLTGGLFSFLIMYFFLKLFGKRFIPLTSVAGALSHNLGQFAVALIVVWTPGLLTYLPFLMLSGMLTGLFTGLCCLFANKYIAPRLIT